MLGSLPLTMAKCLILTILIESSAAAIAGVREKYDYIIIALVNVITNPVLVALTSLSGYFYGHESYFAFAVTGEIGAFITEGIIYKKSLSFKKINPFLLSLILNGASYLSGLVIGRFLR